MLAHASYENMTIRKHHLSVSKSPKRAIERKLPSFSIYGIPWILSSLIASFKKNSRVFINWPTVGTSPSRRIRHETKGISTGSALCTTYSWPATKAGSPQDSGASPKRSQSRPFHSSPLRSSFQASTYSGKGKTAPNFLIFFARSTEINNISLTTKTKTMIKTKNSIGLHS